MKHFDIAGMEVFGYEQRNQNVFYETSEFKMRVIALAAGESMPECEMSSHVVFVCIDGDAEVDVGGENVAMSKGQCVVTEPATLTMKTNAGARLLGIQIARCHTDESARG